MPPVLWYVSLMCHQETKGRCTISECSLLPFISRFQWLNNMFYLMRQTETRQQLLGTPINAVFSQIFIHAVLESLQLQLYADSQQTSKQRRLEAFDRPQGAQFLSVSAYLHVQGPCIRSTSGQKWRPSCNCTGAQTLLCRRSCTPGFKWLISQTGFPRL